MISECINLFKSCKIQDINTEYNNINKTRLGI